MPSAGAWVPAAQAPYAAYLCQFQGALPLKEDNFQTVCV